MQPLRLTNRLNSRSARRGLALCLALSGLTAAAFSRPPAARAETESAPALSVAAQIITLYQNGNMGPGSPNASLFVSEQDAEGNFRSSDGALTGRVSAVRSPLGVVLGHRIRFTRRVSPTVTEVYTGAIQSVPNGVHYLAGSYERRTQKDARLKLFQFKGPLPFHGQAFHIGG